MTVEVSVVMPCLNEEATIGDCIQTVRQAFLEHHISGEIIVVDNGSSDHSASIAESLGARVVTERERGYGSAYLRGLQEAKGQYIVMGDSDGTYDFSEIGSFVQLLKQGYDMVVGNRFKGNMSPGAMPWHHRYIGNPALTGILNLFFRAGIGDAHCGMRALTNAACDRLQLRTTGMEFASEMIINAARARLRIAEIPVAYHQRKGKTKLRSFGDGWRHLRFMLLNSPSALFVLPGVALACLGLIPLIALAIHGGPINVGGRGFDFHLSLAGSLVSLLGTQVISLGVYARALALQRGLARNDKLMQMLVAKFSLESGMLLGLLLFLVGASIDAVVLYRWFAGGFGALLEVSRVALGSTLMVVGVQTVFSFLMVGVITIEARPHLDTSDSLMRR